MGIKKYYIETYGCQMNVADSELVAGLLKRQNYRSTDSPAEADIILVNTCSVRQNAEQRALARLAQFKYYKEQNPELILGLIGCVAQRDRGKLLKEKQFIDLVLGPDTYRRLPEIVANKTLPLIDTHLSKEETYQDLLPFRQTRVNAWVSIMRGCNKFCSFCIVPFVRGRERSRPVDSIINEIRQAVSNGFQEITLLGQNVNSYQYHEFRFPELLTAVAGVKGVKRIRFTSPHPADVDDRMLQVMSESENICHHIHLPLQAGSAAVLQRMNRGYTPEQYLDLVQKIRKYLPDCAISTDIIVGFPGETDGDFNQTLYIMDQVIFDNAFMFKYSVRPGTQAAKMIDDVTNDEKAERLNQVIMKQKEHTLIRNQALIGSRQLVLIDGLSKKNKQEVIGRTDSNKQVVIKAGSAQIGDLIRVDIIDAAGVSLFGRIHL